MRVLFLTPQPPYPPHAGNALRTLGLLDGLHAAGASLVLLTFVDAGQPDPATTPAADLCEAIYSIASPPHRSLSARLPDLLFTRHADLARRFYSKEFAEVLVRLLKSDQHFDVIQFEGLEMAAYLPLIKQTRPNAKIIYGAANAEFELQRLIFENDRVKPTRLAATLYSFEQWRRLKRFEAWVCRNSAHVIATSPYDAEAFRKIAPETPVSVVPNGIYAREYMQSDSKLELGTAALLFTGSMGYRPNVDAMLWFTDEILPTIRESVPAARLFIVGKNPHARLDALRQRTDVEITGFVQDVTPFLHSSAVYVAPLRTGSGTRLKLLQAMAAKRAIVSTTIGAQGIEVAPGREMIIADTAAAFAQGVISLLKDPARRETMGKAAQTFVCDHYDWAAIVPRLLEVYKGLGVG
jgi:glycosyltransferase involved in cell wall biosynthesis